MGDDWRSKESGEMHSNHLLPTATVSQARLQLYESTRSPKHQVRKAETPWGKSEIYGRLGQQHADFMEAVQYLALEVIPGPDGSIDILVDPHQIRSSMGGDGDDSDRYSHAAIKKIIDEILGAVITLYPAAGSGFIKAHMVDFVHEAKLEMPCHLTPGKKRRLWHVRISYLYARFLNEDLALHYDPSKVAAIPNGVAQAVARLCLTHKNSIGYEVDTALECVGANPAQIRNRRREVKMCLPQLEAAGVTMVDGKLSKISCPK